MNDFVDHVAAEARASAEVDASGARTVDLSHVDHMKCDRPGCDSIHVLIPQLPKQGETEEWLSYEGRERQAMRTAVAQAEGCGWERIVEAGSCVDLCPSHKEPK